MRFTKFFFFFALPFLPSCLSPGTPPKAEDSPSLNPSAQSQPTPAPQTPPSSQNSLFNIKSTNTCNLPAPSLLSQSQESDFLPTSGKVPAKIASQVTAQFQKIKASAAAMKLSETPFEEAFRKATPCLREQELLRLQIKQAALKSFREAVQGPLQEPQNVNTIELNRENKSALEYLLTQPIANFFKNAIDTLTLFEKDDLSAFKLTSKSADIRKNGSFISLSGILYQDDYVPHTALKSLANALLEKKQGRLSSQEFASKVQEVHQAIQKAKGWLSMNISLNPSTPEIKQSCEELDQIPFQVRSKQESDSGHSFEHLARLQVLAALRNQGVLSEEEYQIEWELSQSDLEQTLGKQNSNTKHVEEQSKLLNSLIPTYQALTD